MSEWTVVLNGRVLAGGEIPEVIGSTPASGVDILGWLSNPPDGLGVPPLRTEDQTFPQRDGVAQYADWYEPRVITLADVSVTPDGCPSCPTAREKAYLLSTAWGRACASAQSELVIYSDCHSPAASGALTGPYGVIGRPRVADVRWVGQGSKVGTGLFRFDSVDHRLYLLDPSGTPGSGVHEQTLSLFDPVNGEYQQWVIDHPDADRYWMLDDTGATAEDSIGANDGTLTGGDRSQPLILPSTSPSWRKDALASLVTVPMPGFTSAISLEFVQTNSVQSFAPFASSDLDFSLQTNTGGTTILTWRGADVGFPSSITESAFHCVIVQDGADLLVYVNGFLRGSVTGLATGAIGAMDWDFNVGVAGKTTPNRSSDVAVYSAVLTAAEVAEHYALAVEPIGGGFPLFDLEGNACVPFQLTLPFSLYNYNARLYIGGSYVGVASNGKDVGDITIDTATGDLTYQTLAGTVVSDPSRITGDPFLQLEPPTPSMALLADPGATGTATLSYRAAVISA